MKHSRTLVLLAVLLAGMIGCAKPHLPSVALKQTLHSEYQNKHDVSRVEVSVGLPVMEIVIPFIRSKPDAPVLLLSAVAMADMSHSGLHDQRLDYDEAFIGGALSNQQGQVSAVANSDGYVMTAEGYHALTNVIRLHGGVSHRNNWSAEDLAPHDRNKATRAYVGGELAVLRHLWVGAEYGVSNAGSDFVKDEFMFRLSWR